ncbi:hypothetical protein YV85_001052 [Salmonella enterica subsp. enterica]|nr:hypothetical protein [Salmonella enterica subsp. enterica serovar Poona]
MNTLTKEEVQAVSDLKAGYTLGHADVTILHSLARIALNSLDATPIYQVQYGQQWRDVTKERYEDHRDHGSPIRIVYAEPPEPVEQSPEIIGYEHRMICGELRPVPKFRVEEKLKEEQEVNAKLAEYSLNKSQTQPSPTLMWLSESYLVHLVSLHRRPVFRHENGDIMLSCQTIACFVDEYFAERRTLAYRQYLYAKLLILDKPNESGYLAHLGETPRLKPRGIRVLNAMFNRFGFMIEHFGGYENLLKHIDKEIA